MSPLTAQQSQSVPERQHENVSDVRPQISGNSNSSSGNLTQSQPTLLSQQFPQAQQGGWNSGAQELIGVQLKPSYSTQPSSMPQDSNGQGLRPPQLLPQPAPQVGATMPQHMRPENSVVPGSMPDVQQDQQMRPPSGETMPQRQQRISISSQQEGNPVQGAPLPNLPNPQQLAMNQQQPSPRPNNLFSAGQQRPGNSPSPRPGPQMPPTLQLGR